ncbi:MAG: WD40/YVTN/BNR-like repeat-containing protein [Gaiellaceae bacterium]
MRNSSSTSGSISEPASPDVAVLFGNGAGLRVERTVDGGATWAPARVPQPPVLMLEIAFTDAQHGLALLQTAQGVAARHPRQALWRTRDGGATWAAVRIR